MKRNVWLTNLACEAENAVLLLPPSEQQYMRFQVAQNIPRLHSQQREQKVNISVKNRQETKLVKQIKEKLPKYNAMVTKADKGNSIVIMYIDDYEQKVLKFISDSGATETNKHTIKQFQTELRRTVNDCHHLIDCNRKWNLFNMNPDTPTLRGLMKIHKADVPIRPVVNYINAPAYKLAKFFTKVLQSHIPLPNIYDLTYSTQLIDEINNTIYHTGKISD
jgi:hypothetical protein